MKPIIIAALLVSASAAAAEDPLRDLDARELHNLGTTRLRAGDHAGAEEALRASLGRDVDALRPPALHNLGHVRFGKGRDALKGRTSGDLTEVTVARSFVEAADADIADMQDQIQHLDDAKKAGVEPDYVPAQAALAGGIGTFRELRKLIPKEEAMLGRRGQADAAWTRSIADFRGANELDGADTAAQSNAEAVEELLRALRRQSADLEEMVEIQRKKLEELRETIRELIRRLPDDQLPPQAQDGEDEEDLFPPERRRPRPQQGGRTNPREGEERRMDEQEARGALEGLRNEFGRKMPSSRRPGEQPGAGGKPEERKGKDY
ncbi:MAG: hypothetical protein FJ410_06980 [Verrucomicrobia bacterium]|nr:hypothetical protein [Verrucomicrobiota bacterium]